MIQMNAHTSKKEVMKLNVMRTTLDRFISNSAHHVLPFYKLLKKESQFEWTSEYQQSFTFMKVALSTPLVLTRPFIEEFLFLYLAISEEEVSVVLIRKPNNQHRMIYFISNALAGPKTRYQKIDKATLALITTSWKLRH